MRHRWISSFDLYEASIWRYRHRARSQHPEDRDKCEIRLISEAVGNGSGDPILFMTEELMQTWTIPEIVPQMHEGHSMDENG